MAGNGCGLNKVPLPSSPWYVYDAVRDLRNTTCCVQGSTLLYGLIERCGRVTVARSLIFWGYMLMPYPDTL